MKGTLNATQKKCAEMLVTKDIHGLTNNQIAENLGIDRVTLYRWKQRPEFNEFMLNLAEEYHRSYLADTYVELRKILTYGTDAHKLKAIELMLKNQGRLKDVQESTTTVKAELTAEDVLKELNI